MLTLLAGGRVLDPANGRDETGDLWFEDGRIVAPDGRAPDARHDASGHIVLAGGHRHPLAHRGSDREHGAAAAPGAAGRARPWTACP